VAALLLATLDAQAYFNPHTGRFASRDPIAESDGPNVYCFVRNNPVNAVDFLGLWNIRRDRTKNWAVAEWQGFQDTPKSLALLLQLEESEFDKWARPLVCYNYEIPNTVVVYTSKKKWFQLNTDAGGGISIANQFRSAAESIGRRAETKGFKVVWMLEKASKPGFVSSWNTDGIYKYAFAGHGSKDGFLPDPELEGAKPTDIEPAPPYKLAAIAALSCYTASAYEVNWDFSTQRYTTSRWRDLLSKRGTFVGYKGDVGWLNLIDQTVIDP